MIQTQAFKSSERRFKDGSPTIAALRRAIRTLSKALTCRRYHGNLPTPQSVSVRNEAAMEDFCDITRWDVHYEAKWCRLVWSFFHVATPRRCSPCRCSNPRTAPSAACLQTEPRRTEARATRKLVSNSSRQLPLTLHSWLCFLLFRCFLQGNTTAY